MRCFHAVSVSAVLLLLLGGAGQSNAGPIIYDNGYPSDVRGGLRSDFDPDPADGDVFQGADDFMLNSGMTTISDVHWLGATGGGSDPDSILFDDFTIRIFNDAGGTAEVNPTVLDLNVGAVDVVSFGAVFEYSVDISPITLEADTTYWLSIVNNTVETPDNWAWGIESFDAGNSLFRDIDGANWTPSVFNLAFKLTGPATSPVIPEPSAALLFGIGFGVVGVAAKRRRVN
jgi:hypothetical protein